MDLREYLFRKRMTVTDFAKQINYNPDYVGFIARKQKRAGMKLAKLIEKATDGQVTIAELMSLNEINDESNS